MYVPVGYLDDLHNFCLDMVLKDLLMFGSTGYFVCSDYLNDIHNNFMHTEDFARWFGPSLAPLKASLFILLPAGLQFLC